MLHLCLLLRIEQLFSCTFYTRFCFKVLLLGKQEGTACFPQPWVLREEGRGETASGEVRMVWAEGPRAVMEPAGRGQMP